MKLSVAILVFVLSVSTCCHSTLLPCLTKRKFEARRNPKHFQLRRCCGDVPYSSINQTCCHSDRVAEICREWALWSAWSVCSAACGGGGRYRTRACNVGEGCRSESAQKQECNQEKCVEDVECRVCAQSDSNEECNNRNQSCKTLNGEGCQNFVRSENSRMFVEKRCKQLQACHTEARTLFMQGVCDPQKTVSLCSYCCEGNNCNDRLIWLQPSWYKEPWDYWLRQLVRYAQAIQDGRHHLPETENFEVFAESRSSVLMADLPQEPGVPILKSAQGKTQSKFLPSGQDSVVIQTILAVYRSNETDPVTALVTELRRLFPNSTEFLQFF